MTADTSMKRMSDRKNYVRKFFGTLPVKKIASVTGWSESKVLLVARNHGLLTPETLSKTLDLDQFRKDYPVKTSDELIKIYNLSQAEIRRYPLLLGLSKKEPPKIQKPLHRSQYERSQYEKIFCRLTAFPEPFIDEVLRLNRRVGIYKQAARELLSLPPENIKKIAMLWMRHYRACNACDLNPEPLALVELIFDHMTENPNPPTTKK